MTTTNPNTSTWTCPWCGTSVTATSQPSWSPARSLVAIIRDGHEPACRRTASPETMTDGEWSIEYGKLLSDGNLFAPTPSIQGAHRLRLKHQESDQPWLLGQQRVWRERAVALDGEVPDEA